MTTKIYFILLLWLGGLTLGIAQEPGTLSLADAIGLALAQNKAIKLQRLQTEVAASQVSKAVAGQGPTVDALGLGSYSNNFSQLDLRTFQPEPAPSEINIEESGVESFNLNLGLRADYVVYDGGQGKQRYRLLVGQSQLARAEQEVLINQTALVVSQLYFELLRIQNQEGFLLENLELSQARLAKIKDRAQFGQANRLAVLRGETSLRQDESALDEVRLAKRQLQEELRFLLDLPADEAFRVLPAFSEWQLPPMQELETTIVRDNPELILARQGILLADDQLSLQQRAQSPLLAASANLGYLYQNNEVQQLAELQSVGGVLGLTARYRIYDGGQRKRSVEKAQLEVAIEQQREDRLEHRLVSQARQERERVLLIREQLRRERENVRTFDEAFAKVEDRYYTGQATALDLRDAQLARLDVRLRIDQLQIDLQKAKLKLDQWQGKLLD